MWSSSVIEAAVTTFLIAMGLVIGGFGLVGLSRFFTAEHSSWAFGFISLVATFGGIALCAVGTVPGYLEED